MTREERDPGILTRLFRGRQRQALGEPDSRQADWARIEQVFTAALEAGDGAAEVVARECVGEPALAREVESLLAAHAAIGPADRLDRELGEHRRREPMSPGERVGPYEVLERLGDGGMGVVYAARDGRLGRTVALKVLSPSLSAPDAVTRRFLLEARSAAALDHPNICAIHEIAESADGRLYIAMPLYRGETLAARIARGPLAAADALGVALDVARGLGHAHARGIVHRDIKPANLFLLEDGTVRILDFGIAKVADMDLTHTGAILGTIPYMSPEQAGDGMVDHRTDLWALGVVLYEMLAGQRPFAGPTPEATIAAILTQEPAPLAGAPGLEASNRLLRRLLAKNPAERVAYADEAVQAIQESLDAVLTGPVWEGGEEGPPIAVDGERRQVAVLAARVHGYAGLVEHWEPSALERLAEQVRERSAGIVHRHGGVVYRFTGESLVCLFGVPTTHEDDVVRAVHAARELHDWSAAGRAGGDDNRALPALGAGVCVGRVVVQPDLATRSHRVTGDPLEAALRLAACASPHETLVGPECQRLLAARFQLETGPPVLLPGAAGPVAPHIVVAEAATLPTDPGNHAPATPFAGRDRELATLRDALSLALSGEGQFVTVEGEAGAGKSRLLHEWAATELDDRIQTVRVWCHPVRLGGPPYAPFVAVLRELLDLGGGPLRGLDPDSVAGAVRGRAPEVADSVPLLLHLLGVTDDSNPPPAYLEGDRFRVAVRDALAALLTLGTRGQPLAVVLEDWHWADQASHDVLKQVAELAPAYRLIVVASYRPEHGVEWPEVMRRRPLHLGPLDPPATRSLIGAIMGAATVAEGMVTAIHRRAGGNPFFVEELCHALREQEAAVIRDGRAELARELETLDLPATIQGVIRTRLDRLDPEARDVARAASVAGRDFTDSLLRHLVFNDVPLPRALRQLRGAGLIHRTQLVPEPHYRFKHALTQEVVYDTLLAHRRCALHGAVARLLEAKYADSPGELADVLAHHFSRAESWREAVRYGLDAARHARALSDYPRALRLTEQAEAWASKLRHEGWRRDALVGILLDQERLCETLGLRQRQHELLARLIDWVDPERDPKSAAAVYRRQGDLHVLLKQYVPARDALDRALELSRQAGSRETERDTLLSLGLLCWHAGRSRDGIPFLQRALAIDRARGARTEVARDLSNLATLHKTLGEWEPAMEALEEAKADAAGDPVLLGYVLYNMGILHRARGDTQSALDCLSQTLELDRAHGVFLEQVWVVSAMASIRLDRGEVDQALAGYREAIEIARGLHLTEGLSVTLRLLGDVLVGLGRDAEAEPYLREAAELFVTLQDVRAEAGTRTRLAEIETRRADHVAAAGSWQRVRELRTDMGDLPGELAAAAGAARALREAGTETARARDLFRDALDIARRLHDRPKQGELHNAAGILEWRAREYGRALDCYEQALAIARELGDPAQEGLALNSIGATLLCQNRLEEARERLEESVALSRAVGQDLLEGHALAILGDAHLGAGEGEEATRCYEASLAVRRRVGDRRGEGWMLHQLARAAELAGEHGRARPLRAEARRLADEVGDPELAGACDAAAMGGHHPTTELW